jgi:FkbM family methyltransferase
MSDLPENSMPIAKLVVKVMNAAPRGLAARLRSGYRVTNLLRPLVNSCLPPGLTEVVVRSGAGRGLRLLIYPHTEKFYWSGTWEPAVQTVLARWLRPGMTFWDIGANIGFFSLIAARLVGPSGQVHAFEPLVENFDRLGASMPLNDLTNIIIHQCAIGARSGMATLNFGRSPLVATLIATPGDTRRVDVSCRTIDEIGQTCRSPDLVKIDVENAELDVLRGGVRFLEQSRPAMVVEFGTPAMVEEARKLLPFYQFVKLDTLVPSHWMLQTVRR